MHINQAARQLSTPPVKIQEAIAQLHQRNHPAFPSADIKDINEAQVQAIAQYLANPQTEQGSGAQPGSAREVGGAFGVVNQRINKTAAAAGVQIAREAVQTVHATATHLLINYSPEEIDRLALEQLGLDAIEDNGADQMMASVLSGLGKRRGAMLDFAQPSPAMTLAGIQPLAQLVLSASSNSDTAEAGSDS